MIYEERILLDTGVGDEIVSRYLIFGDAERLQRCEIETCHASLVSSLVVGQSRSQCHKANRTQKSVEGSKEMMNHDSQPVGIPT